MTVISSTSSATATATVGCITTCIAVASVYLTQPVMAEIGQSFHVLPDEARLAFSAASIAYALAFFFLGPLTDRLDPQRMSLVGLVTAAAALGLASVTGDFKVLLAVLTLQGVAAALVPAAMFALLPRVASKDMVGTYFGMVIAATVVGITLGRAGMSLATARLGLRSGLQLWAIGMLVAAVLNQALPAAAVLPGAAISLRRAYANALGMLRTAALLRLFGIGFCLFFGYLGVLTFLTLHLHQAPFDYDSAAIGSVSLLGLSALLGAPLSGRLTARLGSLKVGLAALCVVLAAIGCLAVAADGTLLGAGIVLLFFGVFSCQPAVFVRIAARVGADRRGAASSLYLLTCLGAGSTASVLLGGVWARGGWPWVCTAGVGAVLLALALMAYDGYRTGAHNT
jgi:YNFM family putative membrane transporter